MLTWILIIIVGGVLGWLASMVMRTDAQQGILLNIVVGIVGAILGGLLLAPMLGGGSITSGDFSLPKSPDLAARRGHPSGSRQPRPPRQRPLSDGIDAKKRAARDDRAALFCCLLKLEAHRHSDLQLLRAGIDLGLGDATCAAMSRA